MIPRILAFAGSTRRESFNKKLVRIAVEAARAAGVDVTLIDLKDFPLPLFDQDLEAERGMPENGLKPKHLFIDPKQQADVEELGGALASFLMKLKASWRSINPLASDRRTGKPLPSRQTGRDLRRPVLHRP
jgi:hypothetical protein